ncbi:precorrin-2 dehydrogenase/sirohydrochlorin ferrochelatase family protein [Acidocella sp.]|uniref:precorrin-2 dehydrogenase/sirohydrochlorin ferrochelatase family protein n=1 Tax=Acidocella sp. TaxID=50710 RepID=UPI003D00008D
MIPLALNPSRLKLGLAGAGAPALRRLRALHRAGAGESLCVFTTDAELTREAGAMAVPHLPAPAEIAGLNLLWIAGLAEPQYRPLAMTARASRVLVNVEDVPEFCDFNAVAEIRRGDLLLAISTGGRAPGLAGAIRKRLEALFPESWAAHVKEIETLRQGWQAERMPMAEAAQRIDQLVEKRRWLPFPK